MKGRTIDLAITKIAALPEEAQERIGQEVLMRVDQLASLRAEIEIGRQELQAGRRRHIEFDELLQELREEYGAEE